MSRLLAIGLLLITSLLAGCVTAHVTPEQLASANYGPEPTDYADRVKAYMETRLKDPMSAVYKFNPVLRRAALVEVVNFEKRRAMGKDGVAFENVYGWTVEVAINAKNSLGGYTGAVQYYFMLPTDREIIDITASLQTKRAAFVD